ncbi:MAG: hypothetical protein ABR970_05895 [Roseiarcus sp.]|jgi:hypothetical protein
MIFALPIIGKVLAGFAASEASAGAAVAQKVGARAVTAAGAAADPADFAVTLDNLDRKAAAKAAQNGPFDPAKI